MTIPTGETIASFASYREAQDTVDRLSKAEFDVKQVSIIGRDLRTVEKVTGRLSYGRAALSGIANGLFFGVFLGLVLSLVNPDMSLTTIAAVALVAAGLGLVGTVIAYTFLRRRRDFTSTQKVVASEYDVVAPAAVAAKARATLAANPRPTA